MSNQQYEYSVTIDIEGVITSRGITAGGVAEAVEKARNRWGDGIRILSVVDVTPDAMLAARDQDAVKERE